MIVRVLDVRVIRKQWQCLLTKKTLFLFFEGLNAWLYGFFFFNMVERIYVVEQIFEFMFSRSTQASSQRQASNFSFFHLQWFWNLIFGRKVIFSRFLNWKSKDIFQATFSRFLLHLYFILSEGVCVCFCVSEASLRILPRKQIFKRNPV